MRFTHKFWRRFGRSISAVGTAFTGYTAYMDFPSTVITLSFICTIIGVFLTNFFVEKNDSGTY